MNFYVRFDYNLKNLKILILRNIYIKFNYLLNIFKKILKFYWYNLNIVKSNFIFKNSN